MRASSSREQPKTPPIFFSDHFGVTPDDLDKHGAFNINLLTDLPVFIDPFLLFNSKKPEYQALHESIIKYLHFLREKSSLPLSAGLVTNLFKFSEVKQNWLGFSIGSNQGRALGNQFAVALNQSLATVLSTFGDSEVTQSSHLEKLTLVNDGVGRDGISDFTTNLIKSFLLEYTQSFARAHIDPSLRQTFRVPRAYFNYATESWVTEDYDLPSQNGDFVLLTPTDMLTRDNTWINRKDLIDGFHRIPDSISDEELRAQVNNYFSSRLTGIKEPKDQDIRRASSATINRFPVLIDYYIAEREEHGDEAVRRSSRRIGEAEDIFVNSVKAVLADMSAKMVFQHGRPSSYTESLNRVLAFKSYIEDKEGYKLINKPGSRPGTEAEVQLLFVPIWYGTTYDVNREPNNGRGPVDFAASLGADDKTLIEFKLGKSTSLKRNLENQVEIYAAANGTWSNIHVIVCFSEKEIDRVNKILKGLQLTSKKSIVVIDARNDNKQSASTI